VIAQIDFEEFPWLEKYFLARGPWSGGYSLEEEGRRGDL
jgi:hypothetical protein